MAEFGKLNFAVSFNPQTAFPLDARYYFDSLSAAQTAASGAVEVGSSEGTYFYGETVCVVADGAADLYIIQPNKTLKAVGSVVLGDDKSIEIVDGKITLKGFGSATAGQQPRISTDGTSIEWYTPDTSTVSGLADTVAGHTTDIANLQSDKADKATTLAGYGITDAMTSTAISEAIQTAIAATGHASFKKVDSVPTAETAEANILYLVMNADTGYYDIYAKVDTEVVRLDDVSINLDAYSTTEQMNAAIATAIANKVGTVTEGKTVVEMIEDAQSAATYDDTELSGRVTTVEGKVTTLVGDDASKSARAIAAEEVAKIVAGADTAYDTLKEISDWISSHTSDAAAMNSAILALQAIVDGIGGDGEKATVVAYVDDAIAALKIGDYAKAADLTDLAGRVSTVEGKAHEHANKTELDEIAVGDKAKWDAAEQKAHEHENKTVLDGITAEKVSAWDGKANDADLAAIAKSGNVNDLVQTDGDYLVFYCGTSSELV